MVELPLLRLAKEPKINHLGGLADTIRALDPSAVVDAYRQTVEAAPRRYLTKEAFFVGHDGGGAASNLRGEKVRAKAIYNTGAPLAVGSAP